jgi:hypothetical protein
LRVRQREEVMYMAGKGKTKGKKPKSKKIKKTPEPAY